MAKTVAESITSKRHDGTAVGMRLRLWKATELDVKTAKPTGRTETYMATDRKDAISNVLYTRQLASKSWYLSPSGKLRGAVRSKTAKTAWKMAEHPVG